MPEVKKQWQKKMNYFANTQEFFYLLHYCNLEPNSQ